MMYQGNPLRQMLSRRSPRGGRPLGVRDGMGMTPPTNTMNNPQLPNISQGALGGLIGGVGKNVFKKFTATRPKNDWSKAKIGTNPYADPNNRQIIGTTQPWYPGAAKIPQNQQPVGGMPLNQPQGAPQVMPPWYRGTARQLPYNPSFRGSGSIM